MLLRHISNSHLQIRVFLECSCTHCQSDPLIKLLFNTFLTFITSSMLLPRSTPLAAPPAVLPAFMLMFVRPRPGPWSLLPSVFSRTAPVLLKFVVRHVFNEIYNSAGYTIIYHSFTCLSSATSDSCSGPSRCSWMFSSASPSSLHYDGF